MILRPAEKEFAPYYQKYISLVQGNDLLAVLQSQLHDVRSMAALVTPERETYRYAPGKWSIREVLGHVIDGERLFGFRAFCVSRMEASSLPTFDENWYVAHSHYDHYPLADLLLEFESVRRANLLFLARLSGEEWSQMGTVGNNPVSVRAIGYIMAGHVRHHLNILGVSYGVA
jgi:hypothetical protein